MFPVPLTHLPLHNHLSLSPPSQPTFNIRCSDHEEWTIEL
jgi:hypothetical protein